MNQPQERSDYSSLNDRMSYLFAIRIAVGSWRKTEADVDRTWRALQEASAAQG